MCTALGWHGEMFTGMGKMSHLFIFKGRVSSSVQAGLELTSNPPVLVSRVLRLQASQHEIINIQPNSWGLGEKTWDRWICLVLRGEIWVSIKLFKIFEALRHTSKIGLRTSPRAIHI